MKKAMNNKGLSIVIPCYNDGNYLVDIIKNITEKCIISYEIIIVDDGSTDATTKKILNKISEEYNINALVQSNSGPGAARNFGIKNSKYEYILSLDADDYALDGYLNESLEIIKDGKCDVVYGDAILFGEMDGIWDLSNLKPIMFIKENPLNNCAVYSKEIWRRVGGYPENRELIGYEDWIFWLKILASGGRFTYLQKAGFKYRIRNNSTSKKVKNVNKLSAYISSFDHQINALEYCRIQGIISSSEFRNILSHIYGLLCYYEFSYGSVFRGYKDWGLSHIYSPRISSFSKCIITSQVNRLLKYLKF